jgi:hypothetical protein
MMINFLDHVQRQNPELPFNQLLWQKWLKAQAQRCEKERERQDARAHEAGREYRRQEYQRQHGS